MQTFYCCTIVCTSFAVATTLLFNQTYVLSCMTRDGELLRKVNKLLPYIADNSTNYLEGMFPELDGQCVQILLNKFSIDFEESMVYQSECEIIKRFVTELHSITRRVIEKYSGILETDNEELPLQDILNQHIRHDEIIRMRSSERKRNVASDCRSLERPKNINPETLQILLARVVEAHGVSLVLYAFQMNQFFHQLKEVKLLLKKKVLSSKCISFNATFINNIHNNPTAIVNFMISLENSNELYKNFSLMAVDLSEKMKEAKEMVRYFQTRAMSISDGSRAMSKLLYAAISEDVHYSYLFKTLMTITEYLTTRNLICTGLIDNINLQLILSQNEIEIREKILIYEEIHLSYNSSLALLKQLEYIAASSSEMVELEKLRKIVEAKRELLEDSQLQLQLAEEVNSNLTARLEENEKRIFQLKERLKTIEFKIHVKSFVLRLGDIFKKEPLASECSGTEFVVHRLEEEIEDIILDEFSKD